MGTHNFGTRVPKSISEDKRLDEENRDTLWWDTICKEIKNVRITYEEFEGDKTPPGYQEI